MVLPSHATLSPFLLLICVCLGSCWNLGHVCLNYSICATRATLLTPDSGPAHWHAAAASAYTPTQTQHSDEHPASPARPGLPSTTPPPQLQVGLGHTKHTSCPRWQGLTRHLKAQREHAQESRSTTVFRATYKRVWYENRGDLRDCTGIERGKAQWCVETTGGAIKSEDVLLASFLSSPAALTGAIGPCAPQEPLNLPITGSVIGCRAPHDDNGNDCTSIRFRFLTPWW